MVWVKRSSFVQNSVLNDLRTGVSFQKKNAFQNVCDEGFSPLSPCEWDNQGLPGLGEGLR